MKLILDDIPATSAKTLLELAAKAHPPPSSDSSTTKPTTKRRRKKSDLGSLLVDKYLEHYGVEYTKKEDAGKTLYVLRRCLFNPDHGNKDAAIVQDVSGKITYQCFHNSCSGRTWSEARSMISGKDNLAKFCEGYKENWDQPGGSRREAGTGLLSKIDISAGAKLSGVSLTLAPPGEIDPSEFFQIANRTRKFIPHRMAKYYVGYLQHLIHTAGLFWRYDGGVWIQMSEYELNHVCVHALEEYCQPNYLEGTIKILRGLVNLEEPKWPAYPQYINCLDGMIDVNTAKVVEHDPKYGSRTQVPCHFNPDAPIDRWMQFLEEIFPGDDHEEKADLLQKFFGYCLLTDNRFEKALFLYGEGANGKGTVLHVLRAMVGQNNTSSLTMQDLGDSRFSVYFLQGKLVNVATETSARDPLATEMFKTIVSGEPVTCEMKFGHKFQFEPYVKFIIAMNEAPVIPDKTYGFARRLLVLGFNQRFDETNRDVTLKDKLLEELDGIFFWALRGLSQIIQDGEFKVGPSINKEHEAFLKELNPTVDFLENAVEENEFEQVEVMALYHAYQKWCRSVGNRQLALKRFNREVISFSPSVRKEPYGPKRRAHWIGLRAKTLLSSSHDPQEKEGDNG